VTEIARRLQITGRVQGVFFRVWAQGQARELGVSGWIRNRPDGSVEAHLESDESAVARMIDRMRRGPANASVEHIVVDDAELQGMGRFEVRH
jgi:acylphosphatase